MALIEDAGLLFVNQADLIRAGMLRSHLGQSFHLFELDGAVYETQGWDEPRRRWWVERVSDALEEPK